MSPSVTQSLLGLLALLVFSLSPARGVVVYGGTGSQNTTAPTSDQGWSYVGSVNYSNGSINASGIYLGQYGGSYWVLTANHVAASGLGSYTINGNTYSFVSNSGHQIGSLDLYVVKIDITSPSDPLLSMSNLSLASSPPSASASVTMIGYGRDRATSTTNYYVDATNWVWSTTNFAGANSTASAYQWAATNTKRWGTNLVATSTTSGGTTYVVTDFQPSSNNGQAATGDSGGGVFTYNSTTGLYELSGVMDLVGNYPNQPSDTSVYYFNYGGTGYAGDATYSIDVATYRSQILAAAPEPQPLLLLLGFGVTGALAFARRRKARNAGHTPSTA